MPDYCILPIFWDESDDASPNLLRVFLKLAGLKIFPPLAAFIIALEVVVPIEVRECFMYCVATEDILFLVFDLENWVSL